MSKRLAGTCTLLAALVGVAVWQAAFAVPAPLLAQEHPPAEAEPGAEPDAEHAGEHESGPPLSPKTDLALWSLVTFLVFLYVLRRFAWGPLRDGLDRRESRIREDIAAAESARAKSEQMLKEHEAKLAAVQDEVREIIAEARRDADHTKQDIIQTAQREAEATRNRAVADIERSKEQALAELFDYVAANVANATEQILGRSLNDQDQDRLIHEALGQLDVRRN